MRDLNFVCKSIWNGSTSRYYIIHCSEWRQKDTSTYLSNAVVLKNTGVLWARVSGSSSIARHAPTPSELRLAKIQPTAERIILSLPWDRPSSSFIDSVAHAYRFVAVAFGNTFRSLCRQFSSRRLLGVNYPRVRTVMHKRRLGRWINECSTLLYSTRYG